MVTLALLHTLAFSAGTADFGASHMCLVLSVLVHGSCGWMVHVVCCGWTSWHVIRGCLSCSRPGHCCCCPQTCIRVVF
jgi:hypothetical protein